MHERLASILGSLLLDGRLPIHARLPSERSLAEQLRVSRATVANTYENLRGEGLLVSRPGAGNWTTLPARRNRGAAPLAPGIRSEPGVLDLAIAVPPPALEVVTAAFGWAVANLGPELAEDQRLNGHGYHPAGIPQLREAIAVRYTERGAPTTPDQIMVTTGAQGAVHLLARQLVTSGDLVMVERPSYPNAIDALRQANARLVSVSVSDGSWDIDQMTGVLAQANPVLAYVIIDFHNPTGAVLPAGDREALVREATRRSTLLLVDETHVELNLDGAPMPPPLAAFDRRDRVISIGSLSKVFWGGLRVGWIRATPELVRRLALERRSVDLAGSVVDQMAATYMLTRLGELLPGRLDVLAHRRDALLAALEKHLPSWSPTRPAGGLSVWARLDRPMSTALADAAERHAVRLVPGPRFGLDGTLERFLRLPFALRAEDLERAVERLAAAERTILTDAALRRSA
ncbi:PLP-dependent aminotransferase family protein [Actinoplanes sp. NPDC026623]|uniref:MocR-like transcription factor YczR n=1 Tax=Actinoplanes sp. NPDC026623 TaxID=3155610 RepID=UPI0033F3B260